MVPARSWNLFLSLLLSLFLCSELAVGQTQFRLETPDRRASSVAVFDGDNLQIVASTGQVTEYRRETMFDSKDGRYLGYWSEELGKILRWPRAMSGKMQIGAVVGGQIAYRESQMVVYPNTASVGSSETRDSRKPVLPPPNSPQLSGLEGLVADLAISKLFELISQPSRRADAEMVRLAAYTTRKTPWVLSRDQRRQLVCRQSGSTTGTDWWVSPAGGGFVRLEAYEGGEVYAMAANANRTLTLDPLAQQAGQLWRVVAAPGIANQYLLVNAAFGGLCLGHTNRGQIGLQPIQYVPNQFWSPFVAPPVPTFRPFWRTVSSEIVANTPMPPAKVELMNTHRYALVLLLADSRRGNAFEQIRIEPGQSTVVTLERDAGATLVETFEVRRLGGLWERRQYVTAVPPVAFYDLSVYEEHLQSIAIDATGKSPNPIEDVNYVPKSVGWLPLPAGPDMPDSSRLDVFPKARAAGNPGAVRRMDPRQFDEPSSETNPLEKILDKYQNLPRRRF